MAQYYLLPKRLAKRAPWTRQPVWFLEGALLRGLLGSVRLLGLPMAARVLPRLFAAVGSRNEAKRRVARRNLQFVLPHLSDTERERAVREVFYYVGLGVVEELFLDRIWEQRSRHLEFRVHPRARPILEGGQPAIYATAHLGAWQLTNLVNREFGLRNCILYHEDPNPWVRRSFLKQRAAFAARMIPASGGIRRILRALADGHSMGGAFDTRLDEGEMIPLFGVPAPTNTIPARLALRGYPLIPLRGIRLPGLRFRVELAAPLEPGNPGASRREQAIDLSRQLNEHFERWIRDAPTQWLCLKRRWPKDAIPASSL